MLSKAQFWMAMLVVAVVVLGAIVLAFRLANTAEAASHSRQLSLLVTSLIA